MLRRFYEAHVVQSVQNLIELVGSATIRINSDFKLEVRSKYIYIYIYIIHTDPDCNSQRT